MTDSISSWEELQAGIDSSRFPEVWRHDGSWSVTVLEQVLGNDWLDKFEANSGYSFPKASLAPNYLPSLAWLIEFAARLMVLKNVPGLNKVLRSVVNQCDNGTVSHAALQLEGASLEFRRTGVVQMEVSKGDRQWHPDVILTRDSGTTFGVECFTMSIGREVEDYLRAEDSSVGVVSRVDGWTRIASRIINKRPQAKAEGWLRVELDDGMFQNERWYKEDFAVDSLEDKAKLFCHLLRQSIGEQFDDLRGIVLSSPPFLSTSEDATEILDDGSVALRRNLPATRIRETFIVPLATSAIQEAKIWEQLYTSEPTWLSWSRTRGILPRAP